MIEIAMVANIALLWLQGLILGLVILTNLIGKREIKIGRRTLIITPRFELNRKQMKIATLLFFAATIGGMTTLICLLANT